jgi:glucose-1-phosphate thymidylyltransferase
MKVLILAAGYGTRLYPLTKSMPKALLDVNGRPMVEHILDKIRGIREIEEIYIVSNAKFYNKFEEWKANYKSQKPITLLNNGTTDDSNKLGAIRDIKFAIDLKEAADDLLIVAGDNLFDFELKNFSDFFKEKKSFCIGLFGIEDLSMAHKYGNVKLDEEKTIVDFVEKPPKALSNLAAMCLYIFPKRGISVLNNYLEEGNNPDAVGYFIQWLVKRDKVYGYQFDGKWLDIGDMNSYNKAKEEFRFYGGH